MKYSIIFVATAAASSYDAYNQGYGENKVSSAVKPSSTPCSTAKPTGYTTIYPGYDKYPVTVTSQYQPYPTCVSAGYDGKSCGKWEEDMYVSTTIRDYDGNYKVITKTEEPVTVYHTKKTITHSATGKYGYPTSSAGYAKPTGSYGSKNGTDGCWYELYEKVEEVPYKKLGPHALPGYGGSGLYPEGDKEQPVKVKEYKGGKWTEYEHVYKYGKPEEEVKTYEKPGVYTESAKDVYVDKPYTAPAMATKTAKAGETCTYGGAYVEATSTGYVTGAYGAYETKYVSGKPVTETVVKYTTVYVTKTGTVEIAKPTTTVYDHDTEVAYPTAKSYEQGYYHQDAKTVTVTKSGEAYTCTYEKKDYPTASSKIEYPVHQTKTPSHDDSYGYKPQPTPYKPTEGEHGYPSYPSNGNGTYAHSKPNYPAQSYPVKATSTPCSESATYPVATSTPAYPEYPVKASSTPAYPEYPVKASSTPSYPEYPVKASSVPAYPEYPVKASSTPVYPAGATSTPCEDDKKPSPTPYKPNNGESYPAYPAASSPAAYNAYPAASSPAAYNAYPAASPSPYKPADSYPSYPEEAKKSTPAAYNAYPAATPAYGAGYKRSRVARAL